MSDIIMSLFGFITNYFTWMFEFLKNNISWIKDLFTLIFTGTATIIAILAYIRAKATILQPIRNEVIKKQSSILSDILKKISDNENSIDNGLDYVNIAPLNAYMILKEYGFIFDKELEKERLDQIISGWMYVGESKIIKDVKILGVYSESKTEKKPFEKGKEKFEKSKEGIIEIEKIYLTKKYKNFFKELSEYADDPFLPESIQLILRNIISDVKTNLTQNLKIVLINFTKEFCKKHFAGEDTGKITLVGVYNEFNHNRIHHNQDLIKLKKEVRKYLKIDDKWY